MPQIGEIRWFPYNGGRRREIWQTCKDCGEGRWLYKSTWDRGQARRCRPCFVLKHCKSKWGKPHYREEHGNWKGGKIETSAGYIRMLLLPDDTYYSMACKNHYVLEHRLVMAKALGRCLRNEEVIHHLNGIRNDNRTENLALTNNKVHPKKTLIKLLQNRIRELELGR